MPLVVFQDHEEDQRVFLLDLVEYVLYDQHLREIYEL